MTPPTPPGTEQHGTLRIDAAPGANKFQGVWLERSATSRFVIDYRAREFWLGFADQSVIVTGHCFEPWGEAIRAPHFKVERMRLAGRATRSIPYLEIGAEQELQGTFIDHTWPAQTKLAGSVDHGFRVGAQTYWIAGGQDAPLPDGTPGKILARVLKPDRAYTAGTGDDQIWILGMQPDAEDETGHRPKLIPCPSE